MRVLKSLCRFKMCADVKDSLVGVTNGLCEHAEHCDFFASTSRNKKFALRACEQRRNLGSTSKRALV